MLKLLKNDGQCIISKNGFLNHIESENKINRLISNIQKEYNSFLGKKTNVHNFTHFKLRFKIHNCSVDMFNHSHGKYTTLSLKILIILQHSQIFIFYKNSFVAELYNIYLWHLVKS